MTILRSQITQVLAPTSLSSGSSSVFSASFNGSGYRSALAYLSVGSTGIPNSTAVPMEAAPSVRFLPMFSIDGTTDFYNDFREGVWAQMLLQANNTTTRRAHSLDLAGRTMRFQVIRNSSGEAPMTDSVSIEAHTGKYEDGGLGV